MDFKPEPKGWRGGRVASCPRVWPPTDPELASMAPDMGQILDTEPQTPLILLSNTGGFRLAKADRAGAAAVPVRQR